MVAVVVAGMWDELAAVLVKLCSGGRAATVGILAVLQ